MGRRPGPLWAAEGWASFPAPGDLWADSGEEPPGVGAAGVARSPLLASRAASLAQAGSSAEGPLLGAAPEASPP